MIEVLAGVKPTTLPPFDPKTLFKPDGFWTKKLAANEPLHPQSQQWADNLCSQMGLDPGTPDSANHPTALPGASSGQAWFSVTTGGAPVIVVDEYQPLVPVATKQVIDGTSWNYNLGWHNVCMQGIPIPPGAIHDGSSDASLVIYQPSTHRIWELYYAYNQPGTYDGSHGGTAGAYEWWCLGGGLITNPETRNGTYKENPPSEYRLWGHTATSLPIYGGIITEQEWNAAVRDDVPIGHTLHLTVARAQKGFVSPAHRDDGTFNETYVIKEGTRVRFPPDTVFTWLDRSNKYHRGIIALGEAIRDYGLIITDKTGIGCSVRFRNPVNGTTEDGPQGGYDMTGITGQRIWPNEYLWNLPWQRAQVLDPSVSPDD